MLKRLTVIQLANVVLERGFQKFRMVKTTNGYRYDVQGLSANDWDAIEAYEHLTDYERGEILERSNWTLLDSFSASGIKSVYDNLSEETRAKFDTVPVTKILKLAFGGR